MLRKSQFRRKFLRKNEKNIKKNKSNWFENNLFYLLFLSIGIILVGVYKVLTSNLDVGVQPSIFLYLCKEVGMAMIIAIMLVYSIESVTRKKHEKAASQWQDEANKNFFKSVYKRYIPEAVFSEVEACLLSSKVCREKYQISYLLRPMNAQEKNQASNEHFIAEVKSSYTLRNTVDTDITHTLIANLEVPNEEDYVHFTKISTYKVNGASLLTEGTITTNSDGICSFSKDIVIPRNGTVKVLMVGQTAKRNIDSESWSSRLPSNGLKLSVTAPKGVEIKCVANNSSAIVRDEQGGITHWMIFDQIISLP